MTLEHETQEVATICSETSENCLIFLLLASFENLSPNASDFKYLERPRVTYSTIGYNSSSGRFK